jgi:stringent starvation protein B
MADLSTKPYLIRAIYEWCVDSGFTPYLAVQVNSNTRVPPEHVKDGEVVLNISSSATRHLTMDNDAIAFSARFGGVSRELYVPVDAVIGIFARENSQGMFFPRSQEVQSPGVPPAAQDAPEPPDTPPRGKPRLQVIK